MRVRQVRGGGEGVMILINLRDLIYWSVKYNAIPAQVGFVCKVLPFH